jgi:Tfp pilus assembly protein PilF
VANGSTFETEQAPKRLVPQLPFLLWNRHGEYFHDLAPLTPPLAQPHVARGLAVSDYDNDGDPDVLIVRNGEGVQLLRNDTAHGHWAELALRRPPAIAGGAPGFAPGAVVVAHVGNVTLRRAITDGSYLSQGTAVLHIGLGQATRIDRLDVHWNGAAAKTYGPLAGDRRWRITLGNPTPEEIGRRSGPAAASRDAATGGNAAAGMPDRERVLAFWDRQRAGMQALKVEQDLPKAIGLFREALALDPDHEDARYYLATSLAALGDTEAALAQYGELTRINPRSHRGYAAWGTLRAKTARSAADLAAADDSLSKAHQLNPEETGALLVLGEVALMRGAPAVAEERLKAACQTNARAAGGLFLLGYLAWKHGDAAGAAARLQSARAALGPEWKPKGATAEGDVEGDALSDAATPLSRFWEQWDGRATPRTAYRRLDAYLAHR